MEYLLGEDLAQLLLTQRLEPAEAVDLLLEACEAIAEAHQMRIVHRDLKPENLFLAQKPDNTVTIKVLDFGISKQLGEAEHRVLTKASTTLGSPQYMAPEQMEGGHVDVRADVWALGAILYEMLTGRRAFEGETLAQVCVQVLSGKVTPLQEIVPDVPSDLADAIAQCLRPARDERFVSVAALANALAPFGTARSRVSANRIASVLGVRATDPASRNSVPPPTQQSVLVDALQRTEVGAPSEAATSAVVPASSRTVGVVNRRRGRTSIVLGLAAVALVGASVWWLGRGPEVDAGPPVSAVQALEVVTPAPLPVQLPVVTPSKEAPSEQRLSDVAGSPAQLTGGSSSASGLTGALAAPVPDTLRETRSSAPKSMPAVRSPNVAVPKAAPALETKPATAPSLVPKAERFQRDSFGGRR
jgi:serine/threonine-protein kinase